MKALWEALKRGRENGTLTARDRELARKLAKAVEYLQREPRSHPGLDSHEISQLSRRYGQKVFQSDLDEGSEHSRRLYWVYGPERGRITLIGIEPHPEDAKRGAYDRIKLDDLPPRP